MNGYILIHRKLSEWQWYQDSSTLHLFIDLLLDANYDDSMVGLQEVKRGQCLTSLKRISQRTGLTYQQIRTSLSKLEKTQEINKQTTNRYSIITINKYDEYQDINKQLTSKQQTTNNIKNKNNTNNTNKKEINNIYIVEILDHLNMRTGQNYKSTTQKTRDLIKARFNEKFTVDDFKSVIDKMCVEWMNTDMQKYLRPETLFGNKFESYLNREIKPTTKNITLSEEKINELFG